MVDVYSLNPQILPGTSLPKDEHRKAIVSAVVAVVILALFGILYWWWAANRTAGTEMADSQAQLRAQIAQLLSTAKPATQVEIDNVASQLSQAKPASQKTIENVSSQLQKSSTSSI